MLNKRIRIGLPTYDSPDRKVHALAKMNHPENVCFFHLALALTTGSQYQKVWDKSLFRGSLSVASGNGRIIHLRHEMCRFPVQRGGVSSDSAAGKLISDRSITSQR